MKPYYQDEMTTIYHDDCLEVMRTLPDASIDCVITDPPYGTTACKWDSVIPFEPMWKELKRIVKPKAAIVLFGSQPFTSALVMSNSKMFRYEWTWDKIQISNPQLAKIQPLRHIENICVFGLESPVYYPQNLSNDVANVLSRRGKTNNHIQRLNHIKLGKHLDQAFTNYPKTLLRFPNNRTNIVHPTQKPIELLKYLIRTYTKENDVVLDFTMGSGTTLVAAKKLGCKAIGIETEEKYCQIATERLTQNPLLFTEAV